MAELLVHQRTAMTGQVGLLLLFAGQWIGSPTPWRLILTGVFAGMVLLGMTFVRRDVVRARAFLESHPAPEASAA
jgi:type VI protein secretion system component VasK